MKGGPAKSDMRSVEYLFSEGKTIKQVSEQLNISEEGLKPFAPVKKKAAPRKKAN